MSNIFIENTKSFRKYITETHCKEFIVEYYKYRSSNLVFGYNRNKKKLLNVLRTSDIENIKEYIFKVCTEEEEFKYWMEVLKNFADYIYSYIDPLLFNFSDNYNISSTKNDNYVTLNIYTSSFSFLVEFEKSKIKKNSNSLFDNITGLDKNNTLSFIKIIIKNNISNREYKYDYIEGASLNFDNVIDEEIADIQLEYVKNTCNKLIFKFITMIFDQIVYREISNTFESNDMFDFYELEMINY